MIEAAERALATDIKKTAPEKDSKLEAFHKIIQGDREKLKSSATSNNVVTKVSFTAVDYKLS